MIKKEYKIEYFLIISFIFILYTNNFYSFEETLLFGGSDGRFYIQISKYAPYSGEGIDYIKGERFFFPYLIGIFSNIFNLDNFITYQVLSVILCIVFIYLLNQIFKNLEISENIRFISFCIVLFNPYLLRFFISIPTLLLDVIFLISTQLVILSFLKKKKYLFILGLIISVLSRQNGLFIVVSLLLTKLIFKKNSIFTYKDLFVYFVIYLIFFTINTIYANFAFSGNAEIVYKETIFGIFNLNYDFKEFVKYLLFPFLNFGPILFFFIISFLSFKNRDLGGNLLIYLLIFTVLIFGIAFLGGPNVTGKNLTRLSNFAYISLLTSIILIFFKNNLNDFRLTFLNKLIFLFICVIWSFHPTFSKIDIFYPLKTFINF